MANIDRTSRSRRPVREVPENPPVVDEADDIQDFDIDDVDSIFERLDEIVDEDEIELPKYSKRLIRDAHLEEDLISPDTIRDEELLDLNIAMNQRRRITVPVLRLGNTHEEEDGVMGLYVVGTYGQSKIPIRIPVEEFMPDLPTEDAPRRPGSLEMSTPEQQAARYLNRHLGGKADVIVTDITREPGTGRPLITASRLQAMRRDRADHFFTDNRDQLYEVGCIVNARITSVYQRFLYVEVAGVEVRITPEEIAYNFLPDLRTLYSPGQVIQVCIIELETDPASRTVNHLVVSKKEAEEDPREKAFYNYEEGMEVYGKVIRSLPVGSIVDFGDGMTCLAAYNESFTRPEIGTDVIVRIIRTDPATKRLYGFCRSKSLLGEVRA